VELTTMIKLKKLLEKNGVSYEYSCAQVDLNKILAEKIISFGRNHIKDTELHDDGINSVGRENEIHFTILYGITDELPEKTFKLLKNINSFIVELDTIDKFTTADDYDVIKINVKSDYLTKLHYYLEQKLDNENTYKKYIPHITIAYVNKFMGDDLIGNTIFKGIKFIVDKIVFSSKNGKKYIFKLKNG